MISNGELSRIEDAVGAVRLGLIRRRPEGPRPAPTGVHGLSQSAHERHAELALWLDVMRGDVSGGRMGEASGCAVQVAVLALEFVMNVAARAEGRGTDRRSGP